MTTGTEQGGAAGRKPPREKREKRVRGGTLREGARAVQGGLPDEGAAPGGAATGLQQLLHCELPFFASPV